MRNKHYNIGKKNPMYHLDRLLSKNHKKHISKTMKKQWELRAKKMKYALMHKLVKHHLDLNTKNNTKKNIYKLLNGRHQQFHRYAYHYLLEKFGINEILKYKKWFEKNI